MTRKNGRSLLQKGPINYEMFLIIKLLHITRLVHCIFDKHITSIFVIVIMAVFQLGFEKDRVQLADGRHFYAWRTILRVHR